MPGKETADDPVEGSSAVVLWSGGCGLEEMLQTFPGIPVVGIKSKDFPVQAFCFIMSIILGIQLCKFDAGVKVLWIYLHGFP